MTSIKLNARPLGSVRDKNMKSKKLPTRDERLETEKQMLAVAKRKLPELKALLATTWNHWTYEDPIYRFYHASFKVVRVQTTTLKIVAELQALLPHIRLNADFLKIIAEGTDRKSDSSHNANWPKPTRRISPRGMIEAFFHAQHMLLMVCKYAEELSEPPSGLPSGYATVLYLYGLR